MSPLTLHEMLALVDDNEFAELDADSNTATLWCGWVDGSISIVDVIDLA